MTSAFEKLACPVQKWIRAQGWSELRPIQTQSIAAIFDGNADLIIAASTAGGKTEAALLPLVSQILDRHEPLSGFDLLYIGPLKALITDQARRLEEICCETGLPVTPWHGDVPASVKSRAVKGPKGILLITPESLEALFVRRGLEIQRLFGNLQAVIIDELHTVLDSERGVQLRSLLTRVELAIGRSVRRIGLSATLGDMQLACTYLRPDCPEKVDLLVANGGDSELRVQLRGYISGDEGEKAQSTTYRIAEHLFGKLRGSDNLVFGGSRQSVEIYADSLRRICEKELFPQEFYPHHANLSRDHRQFVELRLKKNSTPTTAICTSTLELGIDIGDVACVAQIGAPFSVASLRQRLGRSGRREDQPSVLRQYVVEARLTPVSNYVDRLRLGLVRSVAMIDLLLQRWCEPPRPQALHLSTLVHQILSIIAEHGGSKANWLYRVLCEHGPFKQVTAAIFMDVLRALGRPEIQFIEQCDDGLLLLGSSGERLVEHYSFYAVFQTAEEFRLISNGRELGTIPVANVMAPGMKIIFSGRRWAIEAIDDRDRVIVVVPSRGGIPPIFGGHPGEIHDHVIEQMFSVLQSESTPAYLDQTAKTLLDEARRQFNELEFSTNSIVSLGNNEYALATRVGTVKSDSLALALRSEGFAVETHDGFVTVSSQSSRPADLTEALERLSSGKRVSLFSDEANLMFEKFHPYLTRELLELDALSSRIDAESVATVCRRICRD